MDNPRRYMGFPHVGQMAIVKPFGISSLSSLLSLEKCCAICRHPCVTFFICHGFPPDCFDDPEPMSIYSYIKFVAFSRVVGPIVISCVQVRCSPFTLLDALSKKSPL